MPTFEPVNNDFDEKPKEYICQVPDSQDMIKVNSDSQKNKTAFKVILGCIVFCLILYIVAKIL